MSSATPTPLADAPATARLALACLDLTSLNDGDTAADVHKLCRRAVGAPGRGAVAAVCVWPRFAALARHGLPGDIAVAAVANFPDGGSDVERALRDTREIVAAGAQEVDVVLPWRDFAAAPALLKAVRRACAGLRLKVILETGELGSDDAIRRACRIALDAGADFLKTSTGKARVNATLPAARLLLEAIAADRRAASRVGFKPAGGIRTVADAGQYIALVSEMLGREAVGPMRFRIGASGLLDDIEAVLGGGGSPPAAASNY
ncbi:MAG: deoxyribose-phosphate aldolase [Burkholderiales bacterium]|nr:deoxyribose-phosphate aldolase [Burkholderiales bacterium]